MEFPVVNSGRSHVDRFVNEIAPLVVNEYIKRRKNGERTIYPSTCIAQASLESGYNINTKTLFGIKGDGIVLGTSEYIDGEYVNIKDSFRCYPTVAASIQGYYDLMQSDRYIPATETSDYKEECRQLLACGYATAPDYADNLIYITDRYNLTVFNDYALFVLSEENEEIAVDDVNIEELADRIYNGDFGNGRENRQAEFEKIGFDKDVYEAAQARCNKKYYDI